MYSGCKSRLGEEVKLAGMIDFGYTFGEGNSPP